MFEPRKTENPKMPLEPARKDQQRLCGTFVLRQGLVSMTEKDRNDLLDCLEMAGLLRSI